MLGYHDFGHFAYRVASTWEGRGFLLETPSLPAFWDHFNPGLALLAPLWGLWPDAQALLAAAGCLPGGARPVGIPRRAGLGHAAGRCSDLGRRVPGISGRGATESELFVRLASDQSGAAVDVRGGGCAAGSSLLVGRRVRDLGMQL